MLTYEIATCCLSDPTADYSIGRASGTGLDLNAYHGSVIVGSLSGLCYEILVCVCQAKREERVYWLPFASPHEPAGDLGVCQA